MNEMVGMHNFYCLIMLYDCSLECVCSELMLQPTLMCYVWLCHVCNLDDAS